MNTYYTKCGRKFSKSAKADTTGYHITEQPEQGPKPGNIVDTECATCPFVVDVKEGWPKQVHKRFECRAGSKPPNHTTDWQGILSDKCTIQILSLRHDFCEAVIAYCRDHPFLAASYTQDRPDCRRSVSVSCSQNKSGIAAKKDLIAKFFPPKENTDMGKMSAVNIMDAMKKAKQKTDTLKFAPHPEDLPLQAFTPHPHNEFAKQDTAADIEEMRENIESIGLINPIAVSHRDGTYYILSGECRWRALLLINADDHDKFSYVRATVYENLSPAQEMLILNSANLKARSYTAAQRLEYFQKLKNFLEEEKAAGRYDGPMQLDIAESMGISDRQVRKYEQIDEQFTDEEKQHVIEGKISVDAAAKEAVARRQQKKAGGTGSASGQQPELSHKAQESTPEGPATPPPVVIPTFSKTPSGQPTAAPNALSKIQDDFLQSVRDIDLTEDERRTVAWLKDCEWQTLVNLTSIIQKAIGKANRT